MSRRIVVILSSVLLGMLVLFTSVSKASQVSLFSTPKPNATSVFGSFTNSSLGFSMPGGIFWPFKALGEQILIEASFDFNNKFDRMIIASQTRINLAHELFDLHNPQIGLTTLSKSEKYLERASQVEETKRLAGEDTNRLLSVLQETSNNHQKIVEEMVLTAEEEVRPAIIKESNISRRIYQNSTRLLGHSSK